jgi:hypothetical protein
MQTYHVGLMGIGLLVVLIAIGYLGWRRRLKKQSHSLAKPESSLPNSENSISLRAFYVSTTYQSDSLNRIIAHGLAHRGKVEIQIQTTGILLNRTGEQAIAIPKLSILGISTANATIDKAVEKDGLIVIDWKLGNENVSTFIRATSLSERSSLIEALKKYLQVELSAN